MVKPKIRVLFARNPPDAFDNCHDFPTMRPTLRCPFPGWCVEVIVHLAEYLNFDVEPIVANARIGELDWGMLDNGTWSGALGFLANNTADTICLFYQRTEKRARDFDYSYPVINIRPNYVVHSRPNQLSSNIWNAFTPYDYIIWTFILTFLLIQMGYMLFVAKIEMDMGRRNMLDIPEMIWNLFRLQLYQPFQLDYFTVGGNLTVLVFSLLQCRLFLDMYQNVLLSSLLRPNDQSPFSGADELVDLVASNSYSLITNYQGNWYFEELKTSSNTHFKKLREATSKNTVRVVSSVKEALDEVSIGNFIFPIQEDSLSALKAKERCNLVHIPNAVAEKSSHLIFSRHFNHSKEFNHAIILNMDFIRRTFAKYFQHNFKIIKRTPQCETKKQEKRKPLDMNSLFGVVVVCVGGLIFSLVAFSAEFYVSWQHRMIQLRLQARRAMAEPLHLMAIARFHLGGELVGAHLHEPLAQRPSLLQRGFKLYPHEHRVSVEG